MATLTEGADDLREQLTLLRYTTMRPQEFRLLIWDYCDFNEHRLVFPAQVIKTRRRREATLIDRAEKTLLSRKKRLESLGLSLTGRYVFPLPGVIDGVLTAGVGEAKQRAAHFAQRFRRLVNRCVKKGLIEKEQADERLVPYLFRHRRLTELAKNGHSLLEIMFEAGHANSKTSERYIHLAHSQVSASIRRREQQLEQERVSAMGSAAMAAEAEGRQPSSPSGGEAAAAKSSAAP